MAGNNVELFSVLISVYWKDNARHFEQAMQSLIAQTLKPTEIVLVKDGAISPELEATIETFQSVLPYLKVFQIPENRGLGKALAFGLNHCTFELVARMDSDDIAFKDRFEKQMELMMRHPDIAVLGSHIEEFINEPGDLKKLKKVPLSFEAVKSFSRMRNPMNHPSVMFRKTAILDVGSYKDVPLFEDYYLWMRLIRKGYRIENQDEVLLYFRIGNMMKRRHGIGYFKKEIQFFRRLRTEGLTSNSTFLALIAARLPFRILPLAILKVIYATFLREGSFINKRLN